MRGILEKIKGKYKSLKIEIIFMCLFVFMFIALNGRELAQEASVLYGSASEEQEEAESDSDIRTTEGKEESNSDVQEEAEEERDSDVQGSENELESDSETQETPEASEEETSESITSSADEEEITETDSEEELIETDSKEDSGKDFGAETTDETGSDSKTDETESDSETEETKAVPMWNRLLLSVPVDFQIPMTMPEADAETEDQIALSWFLQWPLGWIGELSKIGESHSFYLLKRMVENRLADYDGDWSVYVKNLKTDESFVVNDRPMKSASVMKLFIMGTVYEAIESGELSRTDEVVSLMNNMITASDNESSNQLLYLLGQSSYADGIAKVDEFIQEYGFSDMTVEYNGFNSSATVLDREHNNQVSAKDCGKLLEDTYHRNWMNRSVANEIEHMLLDQETRYKIPAGLPEGVSCGNKTGEMDMTENDVAVVYGEDCDYILVVLSSDWSSKDQAISRIASMSEMVYEFLN